MGTNQSPEVRILELQRHLGLRLSNAGHPAIWISDSKLSKPKAIAQIGRAKELLKEREAVFYMPAVSSTGSKFQVVAGLNVSVNELLTWAQFAEGIDAEQKLWEEAIEEVKHMPGYSHLDLSMPAEFSEKPPNGTERARELVAELCKRGVARLVGLSRRQAVMFAQLQPSPVLGKRLYRSVFEIAPESLMSGQSGQLKSVDELFSPGNCFVIHVH